MPTKIIIYREQKDGFLHYFRNTDNQSFPLELYADNIFKLRENDPVITENRTDYTIEKISSSDGIATFRLKNQIIGVGGSGGGISQSRVIQLIQQFSGSGGDTFESGKFCFDHNLVQCRVETYDKNGVVLSNVTTPIVVVADKFTITIPTTKKLLYGTFYVYDNGENGGTTFGGQGHITTSNGWANRNQQTSIGSSAVSISKGIFASFVDTNAANNGAPFVNYENAIYMIDLEGGGGGWTGVVKNILANSFDIEFTSYALGQPISTNVYCQFELIEND